MGATVIKTLFYTVCLHFWHRDKVSRTYSIGKIIKPVKVYEEEKPVCIISGENHLQVKLICDLYSINRYK